MQEYANKTRANRAQDEKAGTHTRARTRKHDTKQEQGNKRKEQNK